MKNELQQSFAPILSFFKLRQTFEIGSLNHICKVVVEDPTLLESSTENIFVQFITIVGDIVRMKTNAMSKAQSLSLIVLESLLFNLYSCLKKTDQLRLNNSFYQTLSMSQMSMEASCGQFSYVGQGEEQMIKFNAFIQSLTKNKAFFRRLNIIYERHNHKSRNQRYIQNLIETIQYILTKQKLNKNDFYEGKKTFTPPVISKQEIKQTWHLVNQIIFSNKLNRIVYLLTDVNDEIFYALHRIYFVGMKKQARKHFKQIRYSASDMVYNLIKYYIDSFDKTIDLFQEGRNPLYRFVSTYLECFFIPTFIQFNQFILKCSKIDYDGSMTNFYRSAQTLICTQLVKFIHNLPSYLLEFLHTIYTLIEVKFANNSSQSCCIPVKKLFLYSFLVKNDLISDLFEKTLDLVRFQQICSFIVNLFFPSSIQKYEEQNTSLMQKLIELISGKMNEMIVNLFPDSPQEHGVERYFLQEPIINHDYEIIAEAIKKVQFTPKDLKEFPIRKNQEQDQFLKHKTSNSDLIQSPSIMRNAHKQISWTPPHIPCIEVNECDEDNVDLLTYMTIGGLQDWTKTKQLEKKTKKKLKFESFNEKKLKEVKHLYQQFENFNINLQ